MKRRIRSAAPLQGHYTKQIVIYSYFYYSINTELARQPIRVGLRSKIVGFSSRFLLIRSNPELRNTGFVYIAQMGGFLRQRRDTARGHERPDPLVNPIQSLSPVHVMWTVDFSVFGCLVSGLTRSSQFCIMKKVKKFIDNLSPL